MRRRKQTKKGGIMKTNKIIYLGKRSVYNAGNSKNISIPRLVLKELEKLYPEKEEISEADVYFDKETRELILKF